MTEILIKPQYHDTVIAFNNSGVVLSKRSQLDIVDLGIMAHRSKNPTLLRLFENLPTLQDLQQLKLLIIEQKVMGKPDNGPAGIADTKNETKTTRTRNGSGKRKNEYKTVQ